MWVECFTVRVHVHAKPFNAAKVHEVVVPFFLKLELFLSRLSFQGFKILQLNFVICCCIFLLCIVFFVDPIQYAPFKVLLPTLFQRTFVCGEVPLLWVGVDIFILRVIERLGK